MKDKVHLKNKVYRDMVCSMISGSICQILTNPIWVIRVRMQSAIMHVSDEFDMNHYSTIWRSFKTIYQKEGWIGLYKGSLASQLGRLGVKQGFCT